MSTAVKEPKTIVVKVNGELYDSEYTVDNRSLGDVVRDVADAHGIKAFTVMSGGLKLLEKDRERGAAEFDEIEIVTKDSRG